MRKLRKPSSLLAGVPVSRGAGERSGKGKASVGGRWRIGPQDGWRVAAFTWPFGRLASLGAQAPTGVVGTPPSSTQTQPYWVLLRDEGS